jgi:hypothetical protein
MTRRGRSTPTRKNQERLLQAIITYFCDHPTPSFETIERLDPVSIASEVRGDRPPAPYRCYACDCAGRDCKEIRGVDSRGDWPSDGVWKASKCGWKASRGLKRLLRWDWAVPQRT